MAKASKLSHSLKETQTIKSLLAKLAYREKMDWRCAGV